jgi:hypothetical protein
VRVGAHLGPVWLRAVELEQRPSAARGPGSMSRLSTSVPGWLYADRRTNQAGLSQQAADRLSDARETFPRSADRWSRASKHARPTSGPGPGPGGPRTILLVSSSSVGLSSTTVLRVTPASLQRTDPPKVPPSEPAIDFTAAIDTEPCPNCRTTTGEFREAPLPLLLDLKLQAATIDRHPGSVARAVAHG